MKEDDGSYPNWAMWRYCGGCGQYNGSVKQTATLREFSDLYGFVIRSMGVFDFEEFVKGLERFIKLE